MLTIPSQLNYWCGLLHAAGDGTRAVPRAEPSGNRHREAPGGAAGHADVDLVRRRELGDERVESELGLAAAVPQVRPLTVIGVREQRPVRTAHRLVEIALQVLLRPAVIGEGAGVLG